MSNIHLECLCIRVGSGSLYAEGISVRAALTANPAALKAKLNFTASISSPESSNSERPRIIRLRTTSAQLSGVASISSKLSGTFLHRKNLIAEFDGVFDLTAIYSTKKLVLASGQLRSLYTDKFAGSFDDFNCLQKLYPSKDIALTYTSEIGRFVGPDGELEDLYEFINDGVFVGDYHKNFGTGYLISDDNVTYIQPSAINTIGCYQYKCEVSKPLVTPKNTTFRIRASAPLKNYETETPPQYSIKEIKLEDPSGNLIVEYEDIVVRGDANHYIDNHPNYATYSSVPKENKAQLYQWQDGYPILDLPSGYTLYFKIDVLPLDDAFTDGFDEGFIGFYPDNYAGSGNDNDYLALDGAPCSTRGINAINPIKGIQISALEICNSGALGPAPENYIPMYIEVVPTGLRVERIIYPISVPLYGFDTGIYPTVSSIWSYKNSAQTNESVSGAGKILSTLRQQEIYSDYITLDSAGSIPDSGKLMLKFGHEPVGTMYSIDRGQFDCAFDQSLCGMWIQPSGAFNTLNKTPFLSTDHFFKVETITLKVLAKKAEGSRNYSLDVVGFSDDKLLCVTNAVGGFLQNIEGSGELPISSGFKPVDDLGAGSEPISDKDQYFSGSGQYNDGGDHYLLSTHPIVNSTEFKWYEIPLKIYKDNVELGKSKDYSSSSYFEHLYLDIYPLPTGATIAAMHILVRYAPQNALNMLIEGGENIRKIDKYRSEGKIFPTSRQDNDDILNAGLEYGPLSLIENIPHAYTTPSSIKTNYSRKWRGHEGLVNGPFDPYMFGFSFENPPLDFPFNFGFFDFDNDDGHTIVSRDYSASGTLHYSGPPSDVKYKNIGWRFQESSIFNTKLPGYSGLYETADWTSLSSGVTNFENNPFYGKIFDAFTNVVRTASNSYIDFGHDFDISNGFSLFLRFIPDSDVSGTPNYLNSGVLVSKWGRHNNAHGKSLEFALAYEDGYLCGLARDIGGNLIKVKDTVAYSGYQYPLSVILTYNDHQSSGLKLYTDNEIAYPWTTIRASSIPFQIYSDDSDLIIAKCTGSGIGMHMLVSEFGFSSSGNIVYQEPNLRDKQTTADKFFENHRIKLWNPGESYQNDTYKLWSYLDEDTLTDWNLGDFKYCMFDTSFDILSKRTGRDYISFNMINDGIAYSQKIDFVLPSNINNAVSYHTQVENDSLRFNLSDSASNFFSTFRRITKNLPRGYKFSDRALVVETIIEHETPDNILWEDGSIGPKLIVSLYTKKKDPYWIPDESNWGLINRAIHYVEPSSCLMRLDSTFTYESLIDESEKWALFPNEPRVSEFTEKYFSEDIDDMFLQYDLVYPSGSPFKSRLNIHTAHVRLEDAWVKATENNSSLNISTSGGYPLFEYVNLYASGRYEHTEDFLYLYTIGPIKIENSGLPLYTSGVFVTDSILNLSLLSSGNANDNLNITISGSPFRETYKIEDNVNLSIFGKGVATSKSGNNLGMSIVAYNSQVYNILDPNLLNLFTYGSSGNTVITSNIPLLVYNGFEVPDSGQSSASLNLRMLASQALFSRYPDGSLNLFTFNNTPENKLNLVLYADPLGYGALPQSNGGMNLVIGNNFFLWDNINYGRDINLSDNSYASLPPSDEIRGVDLIGYGSCDSDSPRKAIDPPIITHDTVWRPAVCNDGGIFRAIETYTNLDAGYSGNYYGIRKFSGLAQGTSYDVVMKITTGSTDPIPMPREWEEWEYGSNETINFSGIKLIGDAPYLQGLDSGRLVGDKYGKAVAVKKDLIAVGSPFHNILDEENDIIERAGSVFLYRRNEDVPGQKASWYLEDKLMLPSGYKRDYIEKSINKLICYPNRDFAQFCVSGQKWNLGQEGREFGHSLDIASSGSREILVVGAPGAYWGRTFDTIETSGIPVGMLVFTDKFNNVTNEQISNIKNAARKWNILYKYFAAPWKEGFQPDLSIKILVYELWEYSSSLPGGDDWKWKKNQYEFADDFYHTYLPRLDDTDYPGRYTEMMSGIMGMFNYAFPRGQGPHSGIPPILGLFNDNSFSTGFGFASISGVNEFIKYYQEYAYASGVIDPEIPQSESGYYELVSSSSETWAKSSEDLMNRVLDSGNLILKDALKYITSGVGQEWAQPNAYDFQIPPPSGGRVYIFEKENNKFNLVQEIKSPDEDLFGQPLLGGGSFNPGAGGDDAEVDYLDVYRYKDNDRFGHSVSISENGEIIAIGAPYSSLYPCQIFERNETENERMFENVKDWFNYKGYSYDPLLSNEDLYYQLSQSDKFSLRIDPNFWKFRGGPINLYKKIYNYSYQDIQYTGTWAFIPGKFAGTSRLGYSSAVDDHGTMVAFGAPTDSFNEFDDTNVWYKYLNTWASYTNAGAVRTFESRNYYPHNLVVEYYRFGNLDKSYHPELSEYYDQMGLYFSPDEIPFRRMQFSELDIPKEAGLAFIITPEIDSASDEVIQNIKDWLSLGDRTLVLVGNDPVWEDNGIYKNSNDIINKILEKLNSRMRLVPARNRYESLPSCISNQDYNNDRYNVTKSFVPEYAHSTYIISPNLFAKGVADIKIDLTNIGLSGLNIKSPCDAFSSLEEKLNPHCELPLRHMGDLRAQWNMECEKTEGNKKIKVKYKENWPFHFDNINPAQQCDDYPQQPRPFINRRNEEPRPILTAAEWVPASSVTIPPSSICYYVNRPICEVYDPGKLVLEFAEHHIDEIAFNVQEDINSDASGIFSSYTEGTFIDPEIENNRDALLQGSGESYALPPVRKQRPVSNDSPIIVEESLRSGSVVLIASLEPESSRNLGYDTANENNNDDQNIAFYNNLVMNNCNSSAVIYQIGGWTGRSSFDDAFADSKLKTLFTRYNHVVFENQSIQNLTDTSNAIVNIAWIANPIGEPSLTDISNMKTWLDGLNRKIVITYSADQVVARNVEIICSGLGISSRPFYSESEPGYLVQMTSIFDPPIIGGIPTDPQQRVNGEHPFISGCINGYGFFPSSTGTTAVNKLSIIPSGFPSAFDAVRGSQFIPIKLGENAKKVIYYDKVLKENYWENEFGWKIDADTSITFPVLPGSGYRLFINWVSEKENETYGILARVRGVITDMNPPFNLPGDKGIEIDRTDIFTTKSAKLDFQIPANIDNISITFDTDRWGYIPSNNQDVIPMTPRILSISGCLLPIESGIVPDPTTICRDNWELVCDDIPGSSYIIPERFGPIKTDSAKYCEGPGDTNCPGKLIEDGPVVVAEEFENFSEFTNGNQRSRIVLISDSTIVQGQCPHYRSDALAENQQFIRGLYPESPTGVPGSSRRFNFVQKIISPERGSPAKYYASGLHQLLVQKFGLNGVPENYGNYTSAENNYDPATLLRPANPTTEEERNEEIKVFEEIVIPAFGVFPRFSGGSILDAGIGGGVPDFLKITGYDYIDFDAYPSGFNGDLFGYSLDIHDGKLIVGSPGNGFNGEKIYSWNATVASGLLNINPNGGAGAVFFFEKTNKGSNFISNSLPWEFKQKLKPDSVNLGSGISGSGIISDQFGYSVSMDADFLAVGAPGHDYETIHEHIYASGEFIRKEFNAEFDIPLHNFYDLGFSGIRVGQFNNQSGIQTMNNGAVFTFNNKIVDWQRRSKKWTYAEKIVPQGFYARSGINDFFGRSICIDRARRGDSDYTLVAGAPNHDYPTSGTHITGTLENAGAAYTYDAMLREQISVIPTSGGWIKASTFGDGEKVELMVNQNITGEPISYLTSGRIVANSRGDIFLEASGFDPATRGFIAHRPYVEYIIGSQIYGTGINDFINLYISGEPLITSNDMNLSILGPDSAFVYNNMNLYTASWSNVNVGSGNTPLNFAVFGESGVPISGGLNIVISGVDVTSNLTPLSLSTKGK